MTIEQAFWLLFLWNLMTCVVTNLHLESKIDERTRN